MKNAKITTDAQDGDFEILRAQKAEMLAALIRKKPGEKHYKRTLRAFLEADAALESIAMTRLSAARSTEA